MHGSLACLIGMITIQKHPKDRYGANSTQHQTYFKITKSGKRLDNKRCPEGVTIKSGRDQEEDDPKLPDSGIGKSYANLRSWHAGFSLGCKCFYEPVMLRW